MGKLAFPERSAEFWLAAFHSKAHGPNICGTLRPSDGLFPSMSSYITLPRENSPKLATMQKNPKMEIWLCAFCGTPPLSKKAGKEKKRLRGCPLASHSNQGPFSGRRPKPLPHTQWKTSQPAKPRPAAPPAPLSVSMKQPSSPRVWDSWSQPEVLNRAPGTATQPAVCVCIRGCRFLMGHTLFGFFLARENKRKHIPFWWFPKTETHLWCGAWWFGGTPEATSIYPPTRTEVQTHSPPMRGKLCIHTLLHVGIYYIQMYSCRSMWVCVKIGIHKRLTGICPVGLTVEQGKQGTVNNTHSHMLVYANKIDIYMCLYIYICMHICMYVYVPI